MSESRGKREKKDKHGRFAALKKLSSLKEKGSKHKYEVTEMENVYDTVDEKEYAKQVMSRADDWIVDDNGSGYVEDGRDIFDDDLDSESIAAASASTSGKKSKGEKRKKNVCESAGKGGNLQFLLSNMPAKKKKEEVQLEDDILSELISELDGSEAKRPKMDSPYNQKKAADAYIKSINANSTIKQRPQTAQYSTKKIIEKENKPINIIEPETQKEPTEYEKPEYFEITKTEGIIQPSTFITEPADALTQSDLTTAIDPFETQTEPMDTTQMFDDDLDLSLVETTVQEKPTSNFIDSEFSWESMQQSVIDDTKENVDSGISLLCDESCTVTNEDGKKVFRFFWWDAYEDAGKHPGVVYFFGKTFMGENCVSCCVAVHNIFRKIYLLPRPFHLNGRNEETEKPVSLKDVYDEFNTTFADTVNLKQFMTRKVTKNFAFDPDIPLQSDYLEIRYSAKYRSLPSNTEGRTFSKVFGTKSTFLEILLLEQKIKGPCWIDIIEPEVVSNQVSRCKLEISCTKPANMVITRSEKPIPPPPLVVAAINMRTTIVEGSFINDIVMLTCVAHTKYAVDKKAPNPPFEKHFCVISSSSLPYNIYEAFNKFKGTKIQKVDKERALMNYFIMQIDNLDPDLIVGHDLEGYQMQLLTHKAIGLKLDNPDRLGRLKRKYSYKQEKIHKELFVGRLVCDLKKSAKELIKSRSYDMDTLCQTILHIPEGQRVELDMAEIPKMLTNTEDVLRLISMTMQDTAFILKMMYELNAIPLALQITNIAGNLMSRTLLGGRSERNEFLLLHAFSEKDYIVPDKGEKKRGEPEQTSSKKQASYVGGMVLDPKVGFYDSLILLMDFNSLYPSIIQEYNICFTTVAGTTVEDAVLPDKSVTLGILPTEIRKLVESRRAVKALMNASDISQDLRMQYNIRQLALKLTANSMYGCLGFSNSRFYAPTLAALVTKQGRDILVHTKELVENLNHEVIYGDTDSLMINTNCKEYDQVLKMGVKIKQEVNKLYKQIELDIDGVFKYLLLLKKKKYAAVILTKTKNGELKCEQEFKGLDIVRRDWSRLAAEAGKVVLSYILNDVTTEERTSNIYTHLSKIRDDLKENRVPLPLLLITRFLSKNPEKYAKNVDFPHVIIALRHNSKRGKPLKSGDAVSYIVCEDGSNKPATQRGYLLEEMRADKNLKVDVNYYLSQQIYPVVLRLCEPIEGIEAEGIADALSLDKSAFKKSKSGKSGNSELELKICWDENRFRNAEPLVFMCPSCKMDQIIKTPFSGNLSFLEKCCNSECNLRPLDYVMVLRNKLLVICRRFIAKYNTGKLMCEDPACDYEVKRVPLLFSRAYPVCCGCMRALMFRKYNERDLYQQLAFFGQMFDLSKHGVSVSPEVESGFKLLKNTVDEILKTSGYCQVNLKDLFKGQKTNTTTYSNNSDFVENIDEETETWEDE